MLSEFATINVFNVPYLSGLFNPASYYRSAFYKEQQCLAER